MPSLTRHASVPTTVVAVTTLPNGNEVRVQGAGPWTLTQQEIDALNDVRVRVGASTYTLKA